MLVSKAALEDSRTVAIYSLPKLLARIRRTYDSEPGGDSYLSFFERLTSVDLLHIDDLGAEKRSDWVLEQLYALVNERYEAQRSMLITTNLDHAAAGGADRPAHRLAPGRDLRRAVPLFGDGPPRTSRTRSARVPSQRRRARPPAPTVTIQRLCLAWS